MTLAEMLSGLVHDEIPVPDTEISSVVTDSRRARPSALFVAFRGENADGREFAADAAARGAAAVVSDRPAPAGVEIPWVVVEKPRLVAAILSSRVHEDPWRGIRLVGVTGTNGKTTTAVLLEAIFAAAGWEPAYLGTVGYRWKGRSREAARTTPEADVLSDMLAEMAREGVSACAMEVSSHALALDRVSGFRFDAAVLTNLTRDHLDFHGSFDDYGAAKARLFELRKSGAPAVLNLDDAFARTLHGKLAPPVIGFSASGDPAADIVATSTEASLSGVRTVIRQGGQAWTVESPLVGRFNVENLLAAWGAARAIGVSPDRIRFGLAGCAGAPGRMERVSAGQPFDVFVDFAHTEDALRRTLSSLREVTDKKIILVFGCGGDRDPGKRGPMGRAAAELADIPIATSDNPRGEDPAEILRAVEAGLQSGGASKYLKFVDRREAIFAAVELANSGSIVVIAGKGHETTQTIGTHALPFDDRSVAAEAVARLRRPTLP